MCNNVNKLLFHEKVQNGNMRGGRITTGISFQGKEAMGCRCEECVAREEYRKLKETFT